jgi:hypothetical protein
VVLKISLFVVVDRQWLTSDQQSGSADHGIRALFYLTGRLPSKNLKIQIYRTIILPVVLYRCETSSLTLREEPRLRGFENRVLRRAFGPKRDEVIREWRNYIMRSLVISTPYLIFCGG